MDRLTRDDKDYGRIVCRYDYEKCIDQEEDGGCEYCPHFDKIIKKLCAYEDAEEQGLLLRLPCKVGDEVYLVDFEEKAWDEATVGSIEIDTRDNRILINSDYEYGTWSEDNYVFYSQSEAEKALAELQSK